MLAASVKKRHWGRWVVFGPLFLVVAAVAVSCYFYEDEVVPVDKMVFQKQYSAGPEVDRAVGEAIEKYVSVLDAEYTDHDCWVDHCPRSSKSIPGVPADRALFTTQERANLEGHRGKRAMDRGPVSRVRLYSVAQQPDGMVVAIAEITTVKCLYPGSKDPYSSSSDYYRMILTPSQEGYVVLQDSSIGNPVRERLPEGFHSLYHNTVTKPECAST